MSIGSEMLKLVLRLVFIFYHHPWEKGCLRLLSLCQWGLSFPVSGCSSLESELILSLHEREKIYTEPMANPLKGFKNHPEDCLSISKIYFSNNIILIWENISIRIWICLCDCMIQASLGAFAKILSLY